MCRQSFICSCSAYIPASAAPAPDFLISRSEPAISRLPPRCEDRMLKAFELMKNLVAGGAVELLVSPFPNQEN